nr:redox-sensing transcriptional repressor Rex [Desulfobacterales bacterium]
MKSVKIPSITIYRLSVYARNLAYLDKKNVEVISSEHLADICGINPAQIRKDLAYFGEFGVRGVGYYVKDLLYQLQKILRQDRQWHLGLIGVGNLGAALLQHTHFLKQGYVFVAAFEKDEQKIGKRVGNIIISDIRNLEDVTKKTGMEIGVIATGRSSAQEIVDRLVDAGIKGILNFAPIQLQVPENVFIEYVDFTIKLDVLCYRISSNERERSKLNSIFPKAGSNDKKY